MKTEDKKGILDEAQNALQLLRKIEGDYSEMTCHLRKLYKLVGEESEFGSYLSYLYSQSSFDTGELDMLGNSLESLITKTKKEIQPQTKKGEVEYSRFAQYFIEIHDQVNGLEAEIEALNEVNADIPQELANEAFRHAMILDILTQTGEKVYNKTAKQLYKDGWDFWIKEDAELRDKRYGGKK